MYKKISRVTTILVFLMFFGLLTVYQPYTAFGGPFDKVIQKSSGGSPGVSRNDLDQLYGLVSEADILLLKSLRAVMRMVGNKEEIERMEMKLKKLNETNDPKEREAEIKRIMNDEASTIEKALQREETTQKIEALDAKQRRLLASAIYNIFLAGLRDKGAVDKAQKLLQQIQSNPATAVNYVNDTEKIKNIITTLPPQIDKVLRIGNNLAKLAQSNKIEARLPQSSAEKPKEVDLAGLEDPQPAPATKTASAEKPQQVHVTESEEKQPTPAKGKTADAKQQPSTKTASLERPKEVGLQELDDKQLTPAERKPEDKQPAYTAKMPTVEVAWTFVTILSEPGDHFPGVASVQRGDRLQLVGAKGEWLNVKLENGQKGWVNKRFVK